MVADGFEAGFSHGNHHKKKMVEESRGGGIDFVFVPMTW